MALTSVGLTTQIYNNHIKSALLLAGFPILLMLMMGSFFAALNVMAQSSVATRQVQWDQALQAAQAGLLQYGHWAILGAGIWFAIAWFAQDSMIRAAAGARPVTREEYPKIYNMLENLCISRGITMPHFEIIDSPALNAFASGLSEKNYRIVLTQGIIDTLQDDELEAVIGHELTHIMNRDVRLLVIAVIFVGIISFLAQIVFRSMSSGIRYSRGRRGSGGAGLIMIVALVVLTIGYIFAAVIRFALSRRREYLADAGSIELTKNPEAMMRALMRISGNEKVPGMPAEVQQMCIENTSLFSLFATHPKIEDRIRVISEMTHTPIPQLDAAHPGPWNRDV